MAIISKFFSMFQKVLIDTEGDHQDSDQDLSAGSPMLRSKVVLWFALGAFSEMKILSTLDLSLKLVKKVKLKIWF